MSLRPVLNLGVYSYWVDVLSRVGRQSNLDHPADLTSMIYHVKSVACYHQETSQGTLKADS